MKTKLLNIISIFTILVLVTACGGDASSTSNTTNKSSSVNISVEEASGQNVYFSKTSNVDLKIASMKIDVYKTDDETDTDPSDNTLFNTKALSKDASTWKATLTALEIDSIYILDVTAKNASGQVVSKGTTTQKIQTDVSNDVDIKLVQSSNLFDNPDELPTASNISASQDANGKIELSFNIVNPNEESLTWSLFEAGGTSLSTKFSVNTGTTSNIETLVKVVYTKDTNSNNTDYVLELKSTEGEIRYAFNIDFDGEAVSVTVNTPPIIESLNIVVEGDTLSITPVLDKESSAVTYKWSGYIGPINDMPSDIVGSEKEISFHGYNEYTSVEVTLTVFENGSSSYRRYEITGYSNSNVQLIDTSKEEVLDILGVSKVEADALLAFYQSTFIATNSNFESWNTLTSVADWEGITLEDGVVTRLYLSEYSLRGIIPSELGNLTSLIGLFLAKNKLTGSIPSELGNLSNLEDLYLYSNQLTGSIPTELGNLSNLEHLRLFNNQLTGSIPTELGKLSSLESLWLGKNELTGSITLANNQSFIDFLNGLDYFTFYSNDDLRIESVTSD